MRKYVLDTLERAGFRPRQFKQRIVQRLVASGFGGWENLIDEAAFKDAVTVALDRLLDLEPTVGLGDYLEFGVSRGSSMACVHQVLRERGVHMRQIGFDSFEGMPLESKVQGWEPGSFASTKAATTRFLRSQGVDLGRVRLVKGWFSETLNEQTRKSLSIEKVSIAMFDCDIYSATKQALEFTLPLVRERAVFIFDDWGWRSDVGEIGQSEAFEELVITPGAFETTPLPGYIPQSRLFLIERR